MASITDPEVVAIASRSQGVAVSARPLLPHLRQRLN